jgi:hypothetical protein
MEMSQLRSVAFHEGRVDHCSQCIEQVFAHVFAMGMIDCSCAGLLGGFRNQLDIGQHHPKSNPARGRADV